MSRTQTTVITIIILILLGILIYFAYRAIGPEKTADVANTVATTTMDGYPKIIVAKHQYEEVSEEHIVAGTLETPTICDVLETSTDVSDDGNTATIHFNLTNTSETCAQAIGEQRFKVTFSAPEDVVIKADINGSPIKLNLVPVPEGEDLSNFQIYVKG